MQFARTPIYYKHITGFLVQARHTTIRAAEGKERDIS